MSIEDKIAAVGAIVSAFCLLLCAIQWGTQRAVWAGYLFGILAFPIAWVVTR